MLRRTLLAAPWLARVPEIRREVFLKSPGKGSAVMAYAWYTQPRGVEMMSIEQRWSRSDTIDIAYLRRSRDNGRTWSPPEEQATGRKRPDGMWRKHPRGVWTDARAGRSIEFWVEGVLPTDDPLEGMRRWNVFYSVDGGPARQLIHKGREFSPEHPLPGVWTGKNSVMLGDNASPPIAGPDGTILLPVQIAPLGPDGKPANPGGGYTWHESAVAIGRWRGREIEWELSAPVAGDPQVTTRGMVEPTLARLDGGRLLMVMRGSNDRNPALPAYKWASWSRDGGRTWSAVVPWTYSGGERFFSPSACSQLLQHSTGRLFWLGNLSPENPKGNRPRYPFVIGEVDRGSGLLRRESVRAVDTLAPGENPILTLSNFSAREDRETREICLHMTRLFALPDGWEGDAQLYRIAV